ncbi:hypothetical protein [Streptomyces sp. GS7]|uniref:hypothetical protein n=1 Tax=Streptomyces sp. GS7 TaxID=2692234 RepID=UPI001319278C|nr:hypothetical protein [Streptomyces sp. GS7]QHC20114.1 hypothetical protein GR130_00300 [Streptomyces sp. GS7]
MTSDSPQPPDDSGKREKKKKKKRPEPTAWAAWGSLAVAVIALGNSIYGAQIARDASDQAKRTERRSEEESEKAQASLVSYSFQSNPQGQAESLTILNRSDAAIAKVVMVFEDVKRYVYFDEIPPCSLQKVEQLHKYYLGAHEFIRFLDGDGVAWEKAMADGRSGLKKIDKPDPPQDTSNATPAIAAGESSGALANCR